MRNSQWCGGEEKEEKFPDKFKSLFPFRPYFLGSNLKHNFFNFLKPSIRSLFLSVGLGARHLSQIFSIQCANS